MTSVHIYFVLLKDISQHRDAVSTVLFTCVQTSFSGCPNHIIEEANAPPLSLSLSHSLPCFTNSKAKAMGKDIAKENVLHLSGKKKSLLNVDFLLDTMLGKQIKSTSYVRKTTQF